MTREEIYESIYENPNEIKPHGFNEQRIIIELLLDIREALIGIDKQ